MNTYHLLGTKKKLPYLEQLKVIVIQCMGKQQENQFQQILGKRPGVETKSSGLDPASVEEGVKGLKKQSSKTTIKIDEWVFFHAICFWSSKLKILANSLSACYLSSGWL